MAEVLVQFDASLSGPGDRSYVPRACGRVGEDGRLWEGWIEFVPTDGSTVLRTRRETLQPNREDLLYWATGLTVAYLEGALERALTPPPTVRRRTVEAKPTYEGPAPETSSTPAASSRPKPQAVLDPYEVYAQGEEVLRQELVALNPSHLRNIIRAHRLADEDELDLSQMSRTTLAELIMAAVRKRAE